MEINDFRRLFRYDSWANLEVLRSLNTVKDIPSRCLSLLAHVVGTEYTWCARLKQEPPALAVWPQLTIAECENHVAALKSVWEKYLDDLGGDGLAASVSYTNTKGETFRTGVSDILMHVVMHSAYHRGQIATETRANGHTPAYTDFVHAVRQHKLE
jgi:uncharacterized damage-inducible protein DinB